LKKNRFDDQLERFFQHNPVEDPLYLKRYVKEHPDHKMAWYLLGREYTAQGKEGKAAYCFAQSGEIYEAFEKQKIVVERPDFPAAEKMAVAGRSKLARRGKRVALLAMLLPLLMLASVTPASDRHSGGGEASMPVGGLSATASTAPPLQDDAAKLKLYYADGAWGTLLQRILTAPHDAAGEAVIVQAPKSADGAWEEWNKAVKPMFSVARNGSDASGATLSYYNAQLCGCQAADSAPLQPAVESWVQEREQAAVLQSAIAAYRQKSGTLPQQAEQLARPYPDNLLPGLTPAMQAMFPQTLAAQAAGPAQGAAVAGQPAAEPGAAAARASAAAAAAAQTSAAPLAEPLRILVDTEKHRLAVASGSIIIRSYPVGLGGDKTPEGDFIISEKVRNPNGKSNGEFGSRGMTLSDTLYAIHGTNKPSSIGKDESHGCIRMKQADVEELYDMVPAQTKVSIGKGIVPDAPEGEGDGGTGAGRGNPARAFKVPLQTTDSNPNKVYKWLD